MSSSWGRSAEGNDNDRIKRIVLNCKIAIITRYATKRNCDRQRGCNFDRAGAHARANSVYGECRDNKPVLGKFLRRSFAIAYLSDVCAVFREDDSDGNESSVGHVSIKIHVV